MRITRLKPGQNTPGPHDPSVLMKAASTGTNTLNQAKSKINENCSSGSDKAYCYPPCLAVQINNTSSWKALTLSSWVQGPTDCTLGTSLQSNHNVAGSMSIGQGGKFSFYTGKPVKFSYSLPPEMEGEKYTATGHITVGKNTSNRSHQTKVNFFYDLNNKQAATCNPSGACEIYQKQKPGYKASY